MTDDLIILFYCQSCKRYTPTIKLDEGYVPDVIACRAEGTMDNGCQQGAQKVLGDYPKGAPLTPEWEWFQPHAVGRISATENRAVALAATNLLLIRKRDVA